MNNLTRLSDDSLSNEHDSVCQCGHTKGDHTHCTVVGQTDTHCCRCDCKCWKSKAYPAPDYVRCIHCDGSRILMTDDGDVFCNDCEAGLPKILSLCPKCCDHEISDEKHMTEMKKPGRPPIVKDRCAKCGTPYNSNTCYRVPYAWYWGMKEMMQREVRECKPEPRQLESGYRNAIEVIQDPREPT